MKKVLLLLVVALIVIQFFRPEKNIHPQPQPANIASVYPVPANVDSILMKACNDCHTNNTRYPWYNNIQPVAWWLNHHVDEGKEELNFDEFATYAAARKYDKIKETKKEVDEGEMPIYSYTLVHAEARLTDAEKQALTSWSENIRKQMEATYPKDSLERKRGPEPPDGD